MSNISSSLDLAAKEGAAGRFTRRISYGPERLFGTGDGPSRVERKARNMVARAGRTDQRSRAGGEGRYTLTSREAKLFGGSKVEIEQADLHPFVRGGR